MAEEKEMVMLKVCYDLKVSTEDFQKLVDYYGPWNTEVPTGIIQREVMGIIKNRAQSEGWNWLMGELTRAKGGIG